MCLAVILLSRLDEFFFDISKAFDKVWHESLLFKLRPMGISGEL